MKKIILCFLAAILIVGCAGPKKKLEETIFYPPLPELPRLQFLTSISSEDDLKSQGSFEEFLVGKKESTRDILRPFGFGAVKGKIYVVDRDHKNIIIVDLNDKKFGYVQAKGLGTLYDPGGIWVTEDNEKYIADFGRQQIVVYSSDEEFIRTYGEEGQLNRPLDVAVYGNNIYVCDFNKHQIIVFDRESGEIVNTIGSVGNLEGELYKPTHVTVDNWGDLYVMDAYNFRVQKFNSEGQHIATIGYHGDTFGGFARPKGIGVDREQHLYVVDIAFENVQIFDSETGQLLLFFGQYGRNPGDMYLPTATYVDYENDDYFQKYADKNFRLKYVVYVGNSLGKAKVNVYGFGDWVGPPLPKTQ